MTLWVCTDCTTVYTVGAPCCPHCRSTEHVEQGEPMPKITRCGGPTIAGAATATPAAAAPVPDPIIRTDAQLTDKPEGGEESSPGSSSSASTETQPTPSEPSEQPLPKRAPRTGSRSGKGRTASSSAPSTDGQSTEPTSADGDA